MQNQDAPKPPETRRGFIHLRSDFLTALISDFITKISVKSTSSPGFLKILPHGGFEVIAPTPYFCIQCVKPLDPLLGAQ
jgi:hypothetical protein